MTCLLKILQMKSLRQQSGISYIEVLLAVFIIGFLVLVLNSLPPAVSSINRSRYTSVAKNVVMKRLEYIRKQNYSNLVNGTFYITKEMEPTLISLPSPVATYEINDCPITVCTSSETAKEVKVTVSWNESGKNQDVDMTTLISPGGLGQ